MNILLWIVSRFIRKLNFGDWLIQEELRGNLITAIKETPIQFPQFLKEYLGFTINPIINILFDRIDWMFFIELMVLVFEKTKIRTDIPLTRYQQKKEKIEEISWNYKGRMKYYLIHILAKSYGWDDTYIRKLPVNTALAYIQEIFVDEQLDKEFYYGLSEIAYPYNKNTNKSEFKPLPRPTWMQREIKQVQKIKMPKMLVPVGVVQDLSGMEKYFETQETKFE